MNNFNKILKTETSDLFKAKKLAKNIKINTISEANLKYQPFVSGSVPTFVQTTQPSYTQPYLWIKI